MALLLNDYVRHMTRASSQYHGLVSEFVGDGLLASPNSA